MARATLRVFREDPEARRLAVIFAVVYFAQGMWYLPNLSITFLLKEKMGLSAAQTAAFFSITVIPWLIKPVYGLISDFVPLFGRRRKSYFLLTTGLSAATGFFLSSLGMYTYWKVAIFFTLMGLGLASTDVLTAAFFPLISFTMAIWCVRDPQVKAGERQFRETWLAIRGAIRSRPLWIVAGFIFFYNFSPSFGPALVYYSTDVLHFSKIFLGGLDSLTYASGLVGAALYFAYSKSFPFRWLIHFAIAAGVISTLAYLGYTSQASAVALALGFGGVGMIIQLTFLDLAAKACPKQAEGTFFALLMSVYNGAVQLSQIAGGWLYDRIGFTNLILISAAFTAAAWLLMPLLRVEEIEARARENALVSPAPAGS